MSKQPDRHPHDGEFCITRLSTGAFAISCTHEGQRTQCVAGPFNAWRIFAMLSLMLGIDLPSKLMKGIKI